MKRFLVLAVMVAACGEVSTQVDGRLVDGGKVDGGTVDGGTVDGGLVDAGSSRCTTTGAECSGALRGSSGCDAPTPACDPATEFVVSVACHYLPDGGQYAVNGIAGAWCYRLPPQCASSPTCDCLTAFGGFHLDGGSLSCPGNYYRCLDQSTPRDLHCNPP